MRKTRRNWLLFAFASFLVLAALLQVSRALIDAAFQQRRAEEARRQQSRERVALWQLDFAIAPLIAFETGRAISVAYGVRPQDPAGEDFVTLRFDRREPDRYRLPLPAPLGSVWLDRDQLDGTVRAAIDVLTWPADVTSLLPVGSDLVAFDQAWTRNEASRSAEANLDQNDLQGRQLQQRRSNALNPVNNFSNARSPDESELHPVTSIEPFRPVWIDRRDGAAAELVLVRRSESEAILQFVVLDHQRLESWLKEEVRELLPDLRLLPQRDEPRPGEAVLASLPYRLESSGRAGEVALDASFITTLGITWGAVLLALGTAAFVLRATTTLSERRARFVSTVTHELRTPLTTFRMYAQMLARDMVSDADKRRSYLATLEEESERLSRVVESVLLYSRLEEGRAEARREVMTLDDLADRLLAPLGRAAQAGAIELELDAQSELELEELVDPETRRERGGDRELRVDAQTVEQILVNLVDNAAKYGRGDEARLSLRLWLEGEQLVIDASDRGPGIPAGERRAIFEPFRRAAVHVAGQAPGIGLGLALARGLARAQGGELELLPSTIGATFRLRLPRV